MMKSFPERLASVVLACKGADAVRQLRYTATAASRHGRLDTAATLRCMAEAAEREVAADLRQISTASAELGSIYQQTLSDGP
jgi:hypothetical protein